MKCSSVFWILLRTLVIVLVIISTYIQHIPSIHIPEFFVRNITRNANASSSTPPKPQTQDYHHKTTPTVIRCDNTTTMAVHIIHYLPNTNTDASIRNQHTAKVIRTLSGLPFYKIYFYLHTNHKGVSPSMFSFDPTLKSYTRRRVVVVTYNPMPWWSKPNGNEWSALVWAAREYMTTKARRFKIVMCMDNDILVTPEAILNYWCVYAPMAMDQGHHLNFVLFDQTWKSKRYPSGLMTYLRYPLEKDKFIRWGGTDLVYAHANWSYIPDYYLPLWIIDSRRKRMFFDNSFFFYHLHLLLVNGDTNGYKIKNRWMAQEEAYLSVFTTLFSSPPVLGARCVSRGENTDAKECHIHPDAFLHHLPNNYGGNEGFVQREHPLSVDEIYCLEKDAKCPSFEERSVAARIQKYSNLDSL